MNTSDDSQAMAELHKRLLHLRSRMARHPSQQFDEEGEQNNRHLGRLEQLRVEMASPEESRPDLAADIRSTQEEIEVFLDWAEDTLPDVPHGVGMVFEVTAPPGETPPLGFLGATIPPNGRNS